MTEKDAQQRAQEVLKEDTAIKNAIGVVTHNWATLESNLFELFSILSGFGHPDEVMNEARRLPIR